MLETTKLSLNLSNFPVNSLLFPNKLGNRRRRVHAGRFKTKRLQSGANSHVTYVARVRLADRSQWLCNSDNLRFALSILTLDRAEDR